MNSDLDDRVALVTGASRGIGMAIALALANAGAHVAVNYLSSTDQAHDVCALIEKLGRRALPVRADVSRSDEVTRLTKKVEDEFGPVSILVNNAGVTRPQGIDDITERDWDEVVTLNLKSCFLVTQAV